MTRYDSDKAIDNIKKQATEPDVDCDVDEYTTDPKKVMGLLTTLKNTQKDDLIRLSVQNMSFYKDAVDDETEDPDHIAKIIEVCYSIDSKECVKQLHALGLYPKHTSLAPKNAGKQVIVFNFSECAYYVIKAETEFVKKDENTLTYTVKDDGVVSFIFKNEIEIPNKNNKSTLVNISVKKGDEITSTLEYVRIILSQN